MEIKNLSKKKIAILGFWKEGKSTLSFLQKLSCDDITIHDKDSHFSWDIKTISWDTYLEWLEEYDIIFISPGISLYVPELLKVKEKLTSQTQIFFENYTGKVIALTGTKGKSTTSTLIYETLRNAKYRVKFVGNIGNPVLDEIDILSQESYDYVVYELSSYMLEWLKKKNFISILLNIYPDHLDWHHGFENYKNAKLSILKNSENILVGYQLWWEYPEKTKFWKSGKYRFENGDFLIEETKIFDDTNITLLGEHNRYNICGVLWVCDIIGIDFQILKETLKFFSPLKHRLQNIGTYEGITFIDDAISTTPESTIEGIKTFWKNIDTVFLWGTDRWYFYESLVKTLEIYGIKNIVLFPPSGEKIENLLDESFNLFKTKDMKEAVEFAFTHTQNWKICLLSTAAPSYSIWKNFEEKWDLFQKYIHEYASL